MIELLQQMRLEVITKIYNIMDFRVGKVFRRLQNMIKKNPDAKYLTFRGGTSSGKSISIMQYLFLYALEHKNKNIFIISESMVKAKRGLIRDFKTKIIGDASKHIKHNLSESTFTFPSGSIISFISAEKPEAVIGIRSHILFIDETQTVKKSVIDELAQRTEYLVIDAFNPTSLFNYYEEVSEKDNWVEDTSNYLDNPFLSKSIVKDILDRAKKSSNYKAIHIDSKFGSADGLIFEEDNNWMIVEQLPEVYDKIYFSMDLGFSKDPTSINEIGIIGKSVYVKEHVYQTGMLSRDIAREIKIMNPDNHRVISESADPRVISELRKIYGINIKPVSKMEIVASINMMLEYKIFVTDDSLNVIKEFRNYIWSDTKKDKRGHPQPVDLFNHAIDNIRYLFITHFRGKTTIEIL